MTTMKNDPQQDPAEGSRSNVESDLAGGFSATYSGGSGTDAGSTDAGNGMMGITSDQVMSVAGDIVRELPNRFEDAVDALGTTATRLRREDEETLTAFYAAGLGLTLGLLFAGANRLFVLFALAPTAFLGAALFGRLRGTMPARTSSSKSR